MIYSGVKLNDEVKKAEKLYKKALEYTESSVFSFRFKPDFDQVGRYAKESAVIYRRCGEKYQSALIDALLLSASANDKLNLFNHAAAELEEAADLYAKMGNISDAITKYKRASVLYQMNSQPDKAAQTLTNAAKAAEAAKDTSESLALLSLACQALEDSQRAVHCDAVFSKAVGAAVAADRFDEAQSLLARQATLMSLKPEMFASDVSKALLSQALLLLHQRKYAEAQAQLETMASHELANGEHVEAGWALLAAVGESDEARDAAIKAHPVCKYLPAAVARVVRKLPVDAAAQAHARPGESVLEFLTDEPLAEDADFVGDGLADFTEDAPAAATETAPEVKAVPEAVAPAAAGAGDELDLS